MLRLYNSYSRRKEVFKPRVSKKVAMYNCGPTVYDYAHIGNLRTFLLADILRRYLEWRGYQVRQIMNITDVGHMVSDADAGEDKMALAVRREGKGPKEVARFYEEKFFEDIRALGFKPAGKYPRASEHVGETVKMVQKLLQKGKAYLVQEKGGASVYYDLSTFPRWGKLSGNKLEDLISGARVEVIHEKRQPYDFALWIYKPNHILQWPSPWGQGYPGWHLECSAMAMKYLGPTLDIHTGGEDNKFPHHECEIAQSEGATGKKFSRFWLHVKHLLVEGKKMSKSLGNFYTLRDLMQKGFSPRVIRYTLISAHYRESLNFTMAGLKGAESALKRVDELVEKLTYRHDKSLALSRSTKLSFALSRTRRDFVAAMDDDLNVPKALAVLFRFTRSVNRKLTAYSRQPTALDRRLILKLLQEFDQVLGLGIDERKKTVVPEAVRKLVDEREQARQAKQWARADELREEIKKHGYAVEDTSSGSRVKML